MNDLLSVSFDRVDTGGAHTIRQTLSTLSGATVIVDMDAELALRAAMGLVAALDTLVAPGV